MRADDAVLDQIRELGFAYLLPVRPELIERAQRDIQNVKAGDHDQHPGLSYLFSETGIHDQANRLVGGINHLPEQLQLTRRQNGDGGHAHLDGYWPENEERINTPDAVLGVYLSDVPAPRYGAFKVWSDGRSAVQTWAKPLINLPKKNESQPEKQGEPLHVLGAAGTAFIIHGAVQHCNELRTIEPGLRDAVFLRVYRQERRDVLAMLKSGGNSWDY